MSVFQTKRCFTRKKRRLFIYQFFSVLSCLLLIVTCSWANIPAAYLACEVAQEKEPCALPGPQYGVCILDTLCEDPSETTVNECMICVDECWGSEDGLPCVRPWTGEQGICESQTQCTDKPETSFEECRRCVEVTSHSPYDMINETVTEEDSGCAVEFPPFRQTIYSLWWLYVLLCIRAVLKRQDLTN